MDDATQSMITKKQKLFDRFAAHLTQARRDAIIRCAQERTRYLTVVLEDLYQAHNISAVMRTADCFGVQDIHIIETTNRFKVAKGISKGASQWLTVERYPQDMIGCFKRLRSNGYKIIATTPHKDDVLIQDVPIDSKLALVFGTEQEGLSKEALEQADGFVKVPLYGFTESFNISVCAGIVLYELSKRIRESSYDWRLNKEEQLDMQLSWLIATTTSGAQIAQELAQLSSE